MKLLFAAAMPLVAVACAPLAPLNTSSEFVTVADTASPVSILEAGPAIIYQSRTVQEPGNWIELNDAQAPGVE